MKKEVYNLEFPSWCNQITVFGYQFSRVPEYKERLQSLQHLVAVSSEFQICRNTGRHAVTAYVEIPQPEEKAVIEDSAKHGTALDDILLLLSIFSQRHVFAVENGCQEDNNLIVMADHRCYPFGGILRCSIPYKARAARHPPHSYDVGFEEGLNLIYKRVRSEDWLRTYEHGRLLILADRAFRQDLVEAAFTQCWTIWEHLFTVLNRTWLSDDHIRRLRSTEKLSYLLVKYALKNKVKDSDKKRIKTLADARNSLVHHGCFPEHSSVRSDAVLFVHLTEFIIAKILGLSPSNVFNTMENLEDFLKRQHRSAASSTTSGTLPTKKSESSRRV